MRRFDDPLSQSLTGRAPELVEGVAPGVTPRAT